MSALVLAFLLKWLIELGINVVIEKWYDLKGQLEVKGQYVVKAPGVATDNSNWQFVFSSILPQTCILLDRFEIEMFIYIYIFAFWSNIHIRIQ